MQSLLRFTTGLILLAFWVNPLSAIQMPPQLSAVQKEHGTKSLDAEMANHQQEMQALTARLNQSAQIIANARDAKGYVHDKAIIKAHEVDIRAFRNSFRDHKEFLKTYEDVCGVNGKQHDAMVQHQQMMKSVLYDVVETFDTFEISNDGPNNPNVVITVYVGPAFDLHQNALKELTGAVAQHQQAMTEMMSKCPKVQ